jgi:hypothetical protein
MTVRRTEHVSVYAVGWRRAACTLEELLLELSLGDLNLDRLVHLLVVSSLVVGIVLDGGGEERVDEGGLSQPRLASDHDSKGSTALGHNLVSVPTLGSLLACPQGVAYRWLGNYGAASAMVQRASGRDILTLAMPIGEANSAMVRATSLCLGVCAV